MRLATLRDGSRDGQLVVVDRSAKKFARASDIAPHLQAALDDWARAEAALFALNERLEKGEVHAESLDVRALSAPLPRAYEWIDGSSYLNHVRLARKARGAEPPKDLETDPLVYQGGSGVLLAATDPLVLADETWGLDFEAEIAAVLGDVPRGTTTDSAPKYTRLFMLANDVTYRNLVPPELAKGFGFFVSKPATAFSPFAVTADELGGAYRDGRVHLHMRVTYNDNLVGDLDTGPEMHFSFSI